MPKKKKVLSPEDAAISKVLMERNRGKNFVDRAFDIGQDKPSPYLGNKTHYMAYDPNSMRVYPTVVQLPGQSKLTELDPDQAYDYADESAEYIKAPTAKIAASLSEYGYKKASGMIKKKGGKVIKPKKMDGGGKAKPNKFEYVHEDKHGNKFVLHKSDEPITQTQFDHLVNVSRAYPYNPQATGSFLPSRPIYDVMPPEQPMGAGGMELLNNMPIPGLATTRAAGGEVTPQERESWNKYKGMMRNQPGYNTANWDHNQSFQQDMMKQAGFDPSRVSAIQADMLERNQSMPGSVKYGPQGLSAADSWVGSKTKDQSYQKYEYLHYDKNGQQYPGTAGHIAPTTEPMTQEQMNTWGNQPRMAATPGAPMPQAPAQPMSPRPAPTGLAATGFPTREEAIAKYKAKKAAGMSGASGPETNYSVDQFRTALPEYGQAGSAFGCENDLNSWTPNSQNTGQDEFRRGGMVKRMDDGGINLQLNSSQMMMGALAGADALVTKFIYNPQVQAMEANNKRKQMQPVTAPNQFYGEGMGMYKKGGMTRGKGNYSYAPYCEDGGRIDDKFENPMTPNTIVEGGEHMVLPNGVSSPIVGDAHSDPSGGEPRSYPEGTRIFSKKLKAPKEFASAVAGRKINKSTSYSDLAKMFDTKKDAEMTGDKITDSTRQFKFQLKNAKLDEIFDHQEASKMPPQGMRKMFGGATLAGNGTEVEMPRDPNSPNPYLPAMGGPTPTYPAFPEPQPWANPHETPAMPSMQPNNFGSGPTGTLIPGLEPAPLRPLPVGPHKALMGPNPDSDYTEPMQERAVPGMPKIKGDSKKSGIKWGGIHGLGDMLPEAFAAVQNMTQEPIWSSKINPNYIKDREVNIQASLNKNYASSQGVRNTGNASVDNARGATGKAALYDANNQLFQNKWNSDQQSKQYADVYNAGAKSRSDEYNAQSMDQLGQRMTARKAVQETTNNNIVESAYQKGKMRQLEDTSLGAYNQMMKDWEWDPVSKKYKPKNQAVASIPKTQTTV